jgi:hypothetical protein
MNRTALCAARFVLPVLYCPPLYCPPLYLRSCTFNQDALVAPLGFTRPFGVSLAILLGYLGILHVLTFLGLLMATRNERR